VENVEKHQMESSVADGNTARRDAGSANHRSTRLTAERADYLVGFHGPPSRALVESFGGEVYAEFAIVNAIAVRLPTRQLTALEKSPMVAYVEPDAEVYARHRLCPGELTGCSELRHINFPTWTSSTGSGIGVAVLDTGIDQNHEDLNVAGGRRFIFRES
jgi:subtilisin